MVVFLFYFYFFLFKFQTLICIVFLVFGFLFPSFLFELAIDSWAMWDSIYFGFERFVLVF